MLKWTVAPEDRRGFYQKRRKLSFRSTTTANKNESNSPKIQNPVYDSNKKSGSGSLFYMTLDQLPLAILKQYEKMLDENTDPGENKIKDKNKKKDDTGKMVLQRNMEIPTIKQAVHRPLPTTANQNQILFSNQKYSDSEEDSLQISNEIGPKWKQAHCKMSRPTHHHRTNAHDITDPEFLEKTSPLFRVKCSLKRKELRKLEKLRQETDKLSRFLRKYYHDCLPLLPPEDEGEGTPEEKNISSFLNQLAKTIKLWDSNKTQFSDSTTDSSESDQMNNNNNTSLMLPPIYEDTEASSDSTVLQQHKIITNNIHFQKGELSNLGLIEVSSKQKNAQFHNSVSEPNDLKFQTKNESFPNVQVPTIRNDQLSKSESKLISNFDENFIKKDKKFKQVKIKLPKSSPNFNTIVDNNEDDGLSEMEFKSILNSQNLETKKLKSVLKAKRLEVNETSNKNDCIEIPIYSNEDFNNSRIIENSKDIETEERIYENQNSISLNEEVKEGSSSSCHSFGNGSPEINRKSLDLSLNPINASSFFQVRDLDTFDPPLEALNFFTPQEEDNKKKIFKTPQRISSTTPKKRLRKKILGKNHLRTPNTTPAGEVLVRIYKNENYVTLHVIEAKGLEVEPRFNKLRLPWKLSFKISFVGDDFDEGVICSKGIQVVDPRKVSINQKFSLEEATEEGRGKLFLTFWKKSERKRSSFIGWTNLDLQSTKVNRDFHLRLRKKKMLRRGTSTETPTPTTFPIGSSTTTTTTNMDLRNESPGNNNNGLDNYLFNHKSTLQNSATMDSGVEDCCNDNHHTSNNNPNNPHSCTHGTHLIFKMRKSPNSGFGFTVVWSNPPKIGRLEKDQSAEVAGLRTGDLITGVNGEDVGSLPLENIYHKMKTTGDSLELEVWREISSSQHCFSNTSMSTTPSPQPPPPPQQTKNPPVSILKPPPPNPPSQQNYQPETQKPRPASSSWKIRFNVEFVEKEDEIVKEFFICELKFFRKVVAALDRYLIPAQSRSLLSPAELHGIFSHVIKIITITKRILECVSHGSGKLGEVLLQTHTDHMSEFLESYTLYTKNLGSAATILADKMTFQLFAKFVLETVVPKGHLDMTSLLFAPLEHLRNLCEISDEISHSLPQWSGFGQELKECYADIVTETDYMEPISHITMKKQPLLSVRHLEKRIVSTKFQDFQVCEKGRRWLFGSRLFRKESDGSFSPVWAFLFTDILVLTSHHTTRDRVFFVRDAPVKLQDVVTLHFNIPKKHENEFRLLFGPEPPPAQSRFEKILPLKHRAKKPVQLVLRTPNIHLKNIWKLLLQRQIISLNTRISKSSSSNFSISEFCEKFPEPESIEEDKEEEEQHQQHADEDPVPVPPPPHTSVTFEKQQMMGGCQQPIQHCSSSNTNTNTINCEPTEKPNQIHVVPEPQVTNNNQPLLNCACEKDEGVQTEDPSPEIEPTDPPKEEKRQDEDDETKSEAFISNVQVQKPRTHQDSPMIGTGGSRRRILYDYKVRRDYPELFGITPRDRRSFIKSIGEKVENGEETGNLVTPYYYISPSPSPLLKRNQIPPPKPLRSFNGPIRYQELKNEPIRNSVLEIKTGILKNGEAQKSQPISKAQYSNSSISLLNRSSSHEVKNWPMRNGNQDMRNGPIGSHCLNLRLRDLVEEQDEERRQSPEESSSNDSGISEEPPPVLPRLRLAQNGLTTARTEVTSALPTDIERNHITKGEMARTLGLVKVDKSTETEDSVPLRMLTYQRRQAFFLNSSSSNPHQIISNTKPTPEPIIVKILQSNPIQTSPLRKILTTAPVNNNSVTTRVSYGMVEEELTAQLERVESSDESTSSDAASASPATNENNTTDPSWSSASSSSLLNEIQSGSGSTNSKRQQQQSIPPPQIKINNEEVEEEEYNYDDEEEEDLSHCSLATMNRYGTYESLEKIDSEESSSYVGGIGSSSGELLKSIPRSRARFAFDDDDEDGIIDEEEEDLFEEDFESDFNFRFPTQFQDNTYCVSSRLGPLPPLLEEDYEDELYEEENQENNTKNQPGTSSTNSILNPPTNSSSISQNRHHGLRSDNSFLLSRIATMYARSSISPLKIFRDLWLKKRYRDWGGGSGGGYKE